MSYLGKFSSCLRIQTATGDYSVSGWVNTITEGKEWAAAWVSSAAVWVYSCLRIQLFEDTDSRGLQLSQGEETLTEGKEWALAWVNLAAVWGYRQPQGTTAASGWVNTRTEGERLNSCLGKFSSCLRKSSTLWRQSKDDCLTTWNLSESAWTVQRPNSWSKSRQKG